MEAIIMTLKDYYQLLRNCGNEPKLLELKAGLNDTRVSWHFSYKIYVCPYISMDRKETCFTCKDRFECYTSRKFNVEAVHNLE